MVILLFFGIFSTGLLSALCYKRFSTISLSYKQIAPAFVSFWTGLLGLVLAAVGLFTGSFSAGRTTLLLGCLAGAFFALAAYLYIKALATGPFIWTTLLMNMSSFVPVVVSLLFLGEVMSLLQFFGILLIVTVVILMVFGKKGEGKAFSLRWLVTAIFMTLSNGGIGSVLRVQHHVSADMQTLPYLSTLFLSASAISFVLYLFVREKGEKVPWKVCVPPAFGLVLAIGLVNLFQVLIMEYVDAVVQFPVATGGGILFSSLAGILLYKEKLTIQFLVSLVLVFVGVVLLTH